ncbi:MAG: methyltransferase domain-containing protein [Arenicellales bacterium]
MTLTTDNTHEFWQERYVNRNTPWDRGGTSPALSDWLGSGEFSPPAKVLVPGCGRGHEVLELARRGFEVTGVDLSEAALTEVQSALDRESLSARLVVADLLNWEPGATFDAVYEQTCLCALLPDYWPDYESRLYHWLKPGGTLAALFMQTGRSGGPPFHCSLEDMRRLFSSARWRWQAGDPARVAHPRDVFEYAVIMRRV